MSDAKTHLAKLHSLIGEFKTHSGDEVIGKMLPEFAELIVALGAELDAAQKAMVRLTWVVTFFTLIMLVIAGAQLYVSMSPPVISKQALSTEHLPYKATPAEKQKTIKNGNENKK